MKTKDGRVQWHPAFAAALRIEFETELDELDIQDEHLLSKKPMQIDVLIVKKDKGTRIRKNIGQIFREHNIVEYKSPDDSLMVNDFYKVYGYTCFYQSDTKHVMEIDPEELTITFVCSHYPYKLVRHLKKARGLHVKRQYSGIYYILGDAIPMQLLITNQLSKEDNYWLSNLRNDLKEEDDIQELLGRYEPWKENLYYQAVMDVIVRANWDNVKEEKENMCDALRELFAEELEECRERGLQEGRAKGRAEGRAEAKAIFKLAASGTSLKEIASQCKLSVEQVKEILE